MKPVNAQYLACPLCQGQLEIAVADSSDEIEEGVLRCTNCDATFPVQRRMPNLIPRSVTETHKLREMEGWVNLWEKKGMYANPTIVHSFSLPFVTGPWRDVARMFLMALDTLQLTGNEFVLDVGAGQGWASRYFAAKGCHVFATDIVGDEWYGLGRAWAIMEHANVYFEPMLADGERMPFPENQFDVVFFCGALHHFIDQGPILQQVYRVLKPGGRIIAAGEPAIALSANEKSVVDPMDEVQEGIVERRPKVYEYWRSLREAGFVDVTLDTFETYHTTPAEIRAWQLSIRQSLLQTSRIRYRPFAWAIFTALAMFPNRLTGQIALHIRGGNILLHGRKPL